MHLLVPRHLLGEDGDDTTFCPQNVSKRLDVTFCHRYVPEHSDESIVTFCHDYVSDQPDVLPGGVGNAGSLGAPALHPSRESRTETAALREVHSEKTTGEEHSVTHMFLNIVFSVCFPGF